MSGAKYFVWSELLTSDSSAAKSFYRKVLGWDMQDMPMFGGTYTTLHAGSVAIGGIMDLPPDVASTGMRPFWAPYIEVDDVDVATQKAKSLGGNILRAAQDIPNVGRFSVVADPQGSIINLFKSAASSMPSISLEPGRVGWHELHAKDWPAVFDFYSTMFGWTKGDAHNMGPMGVYQLFLIGDQAAGGMFSSPNAQGAGHWLLYFNVGDIDQAHQRLTEVGGKVLNGPMQVPGGGWVIQALDAQGAAFALLGSRSS